jgi:hypothetical protein
MQIPYDTRPIVQSGGSTQDEQATRLADRLARPVLRGIYSIPTPRCSPLQYLLIVVDPGLRGSIWISTLQVPSLDCLFPEQLLVAYLSGMNLSERLQMFRDGDVNVIASMSEISFCLLVSFFSFLRFGIAKMFVWLKRGDIML